MVSEAEAKEIAGNHIDQIVGGPEAGYSVSETTNWGAGEHGVTVAVWRVAEEVDNPRHYTVRVDSDGNITDSGWE